MAWQTPTNLVNATIGLFQGTAIWAYNVTFGLFWAMLLLGFCIVLWISTVRYGSERATGYAGVIGILGSLFLVTLGLMTWWITSIFIICGLVGVVYMILNK